jgi:hypothetical protein
MAQCPANTPPPVAAFVLLTDRTGYSAILPVDDAFDAFIAPPLVTCRRSAGRARRPAAPRATGVVQWVLHRVLAHARAGHGRSTRQP